MATPRNARSTGSKRFYSWRNEKYWSVTTILSALPKDALINWAKKYTAEYAVANLAALNELCAGDDPDLIGAVDWLKGASFRVRDKAADLGTYIHDAAEAYALGRPFPEWPEAVAPRMGAFVEFIEKHKPVYIATEASVYNRTQRYAGTLDAIVEIDGKRYVLDMKTSGGTNYPITGKNKGDIYPDVALQLAAYRHAEFIGLPDGSEQEMFETDGALALHLGEDANGEATWRLVEVDAGDEVFRFFLYVREVFRWGQEKSKTVLLGDYMVPEPRTKQEVAA